MIYVILKFEWHVMLLASERELLYFWKSSAMEACHSVTKK